MAEYIDGGGGGGRFGNLFNSMQRGIQSSIMGGSSGSYYPAHCQTLKSGWLKKHGGTLRSWQRKWFNLKDDKTLYVFSSEDETRSPATTIYLNGYRVIELPQTNEQDKFLFDIVPCDSPRIGTSTFYSFDDNASQSGTLERARSGSSSNDNPTYQLWAATDDDRKDWVKHLRRAMFSEKGGGIFGQSLELTLQYDKGGQGRKVPTIVEMCVDFLTIYGLEQEGLFRLPGRSSLIRTLKESFDSAEPVEFVETEIDMHTVASLLKLYLRELPDPLIPISHYETVIRIVTRDLPLNPEKAVEDLTELVQNLPEIAYNMLQYLCQFLYVLSQHEDQNKMSAMNLATCFVHSFIRPELDDPALLMGTSNNRTQVTYVLITESEKLFSKEYTSQGGAVNVDSLVDLGFDLDGNDGGSGDANNVPARQAFDARAAARHADRNTATQQNADDLFALDTNRVSVCNLPDPINPQASDAAARSSQVFEQKLQRGLARTGSKRGALIVDHRESNSSQTDGDQEEEEEEDNDSNLPSPISDYFAVTPQSPPEDLSETTSDLSSSPEKSSEKGCMLRDKTEKSVKKTPIPPPRPMSTRSASVPTPSIPPRPQSVHIPTIPPRPQVRKTFSAQGLSNGTDGAAASAVAENVTTPSLEDISSSRNSLLDVDASDLNVEQLKDHIRALCHELRAERAVTENLKSRYEKLQETHKKTVYDMAAKLDAEKTNMAQSVEKIIALQMKITEYEMTYGPLE